MSLCYLLKDIPAQDLAEAVRLAHKGIYQLEPSVMGKLVGALHESGGSRAARPTSVQTRSAIVDEDHIAEELTEREVEVLRLVATGATNREIAETLIISEGTVKNHVSNILSRLGLRDRTPAAIYARDMNLI